MGRRWTFDGHIAGIGTASGLRVVVGVWQQSPFGAFADVMLEQPSGHRLLLAPTEDVARFIAATYRFDEVRVMDVSATLAAGTLSVEAGPLSVRAVTGRRAFLGWALRSVPRRFAVHPGWLRTVSPLAALAAPGAGTFGTAGSGRLEYYGVTDLHEVDSAVVRWEGADTGPLAPVGPPVAFGFSSVPLRPSLARVRTTVIEP